LEALNRYKKHCLAGKIKIKPIFFLGNGSEKNSRVVRSRAKLSQTQDWPWEAGNHGFYKKKNVYETFMKLIHESAYEMKNQAIKNMLI